MGAPENTLKSDLQRGEVRFGLWLGLGSQVVAEMAAGAGYDWCLIDGEHSPNDPRDTLGQLQAMNGQGASAVVRVPVGEDWVIKRVLDIGAQTVMVPMVETADQAREVVRAMRYPPDGVRGVGAGLGRASAYNTRPGYVQTANQEVCLIAQVECAAALEAIPEIAAVDGVDVVFIGPADLAADMGYPGETNVPAVDAAMAGALATIDRAGKVPGILAFSVEEALRYRDQGARFIGVGADVMMLSAALTGLASDVGAALRG